jgi:hypothetical protein
MRSGELVERGAKPAFQVVALPPHLPELAFDLRQPLLEGTRALVVVRCERNDGFVHALRRTTDARVRTAEAARAGRRRSLPHLGKTRGRRRSPRSTHP